MEEAEEKLLLRNMKRDAEKQRLSDCKNAKKTDVMLGDYLNTGHHFQSEN